MEYSLIRLGAGWEDSFRALRLHSLQSEPTSFANLYEQELVWPPERTQQLLANSYVWGATAANGELVATLALNPYEPLTMKHKVRLNTVYVRPEHRGKGLSRELLLHALEEGADDFEIVTLAVDASNHAAIATYEKLGFARFGYEPNARRYGEEQADDVWMIWQREKA